MTDHTEGIGSYLKDLKCLDMLIIDEADRMVEAGHYNGKCIDGSVLLGLQDKAIAYFLV